MKSYEVLKDTIRPVGAKSIAGDMKLSTSLVYKWCEAHGESDDAGVVNPLDRVLQICQLTDNVAPVTWLCQQTGGFRVDNPNLGKKNRASVIKSTQALLKEFSDVLAAVSESYGDDRRIDPDEACRIRDEWEDLKGIAESFVLACEKGAYDKSS